jgi:hypothetical protein
MAKWPEEFALIQALGLLNVVSGKTFIERGAENLHLDPEKATLRLDERVRRADGLSPRRGNPMPYAKHVKVLTLMAQLRRDFLIHGESDGQATLMPWERRKRNCSGSRNRISVSTRMTSLAQHPERLLGWFATTCNATSPNQELH